MTRLIVFLAVLALGVAAFATPVSTTFYTTPKNLPTFAAGQHLVVKNVGPRGGPQMLCRWGSASVTPASTKLYDFYVSVGQQQVGVVVTKPANCRCAALGGCKATTEVQP